MFCSYSTFLKDYLTTVEKVVIFVTPQHIFLLVSVGRALRILTAVLLRCCALFLLRSLTAVLRSDPLLLRSLTAVLRRYYAPSLLR